MMMVLRQPINLLCCVLELNIAGHVPLPNFQPQGRCWRFYLKGCPQAVVALGLPSSIVHFLLGHLARVWPERPGGWANGECLVGSFAIN